eukprot:symbB.v1.2.001349.t1/scaffold69.1/size353428/4
MHFLLQQGWLRNLPLDDRKLLLVSVPFCAGFMECPLLPQFFAEHWLPQAEVASGISILGTDCNSNMAWSAKERYERLPDKCCNFISAISSPASFRNVP